jgi:hypothetical protein
MTARKLSRRVALRGGVAAAALTVGLSVKAAKADPVVSLYREWRNLIAAACKASDRQDEIERRTGFDCEAIPHVAVPFMHVNYDGSPQVVCFPSQIEKVLRYIGYPENTTRETAEATKAMWRERLHTGLARATRKWDRRYRESGVEAAVQANTAAWDAVSEVEVRIHAMKAVSPSGAAAKLRVALDRMGVPENPDETKWDWEHRLVLSALADLDRLAGAS